MSALTIDPEILHPDGTIGRATPTQETIEQIIAAVNDHADLIDGTNQGPGVFNVLTYGASTSNTGAQNLAAFQLAMAAIDAAGGGTLYFPPGTYMVTRDGLNFYDIIITTGNLAIQGVPGLSVIKVEVGAAAVSVPIMFLDDLSNIRISGITFDGNWGNGYVTVGRDSAGDALPQAVISVAGDISDFPTSGTFLVVLTTGAAQTITYTGKSGNTFTGCSGGTGTMQRGQAIGRSDTQDGLNHSTQVDPKNHAIMLRGCHNISIEDCIFRQTYGDFIWCGHSSDDDTENGTSDLTILRCYGETSARNGLTFGQFCQRVTMRDCRFVNIFTASLDTEPQGANQPVRRVDVDSCFLGGWFYPASGTRTQNIVISVVGGNTLAPGEPSDARGYRFTGCHIVGAIGISQASNVLIDGCTFACDWDGNCFAPIFMQGWGTDIKILNNDIYDNTDDPGSSGHDASISIQLYGNGAINYEPANVRIEGNRIRSRNGNDGIRINSTGGFTYSSGTVVLPVTGSASGVTATTMSDTGAGWTVNAWTGWLVKMDGRVASIESNTSEVLTLSSVGWTTALGAPSTTPAAGTYVIYSTSGVVDVINNEVDCGDDGSPHGGVGIYVFGDRANMRVRVLGNKIKNAFDDAIIVQGVATKPMTYLELADNRWWDDQVTPTTARGITFFSQESLTSCLKLVMRNNGSINSAGTITALTIGGGNIGYWLVNDGDTKQWAGFGTPNAVVTSPLGSTYQRKDGGAGTSFYVNENGGTTWAEK